MKLAQSHPEPERAAAQLAGSPNQRRKGQSCRRDAWQHVVGQDARGSFHPNPRRQAAFTMVEIAISLAVIAFALVAIIGVLPSGMQVQRENREETIINQEASVFLNAIRNGARGLDDLTNYVFAISNYWGLFERVVSGPDYVTNFIRSGIDGYTFLDSDIQSFTPPPVYRLTNGYRIVGLMSRPKYDQLNPPALTLLPPEQYWSNHVVAFVRAMSGVAAEKPPQDNLDVRADAFAYRMICENMQAISNDGLTPYGRQLTNNLRELRLHFRWPISAKGLPGNGRQIFREAVGGHLNSEVDPYVAHPVYFFHPDTFVKAP